MLTHTSSKGFLGHLSTLRQSIAIQYSIPLPLLKTKLQRSFLFSYISMHVSQFSETNNKKMEKQTNKQNETKTSMLIWENNPLTFKFLVTSFGIAVSLYTSFSEIGLYTFNVFLTLLLFMIFFYVCDFFLSFWCFLNIVHH